MQYFHREPKPWLKTRQMAAVSIAQLPVWIHSQENFGNCSLFQKSRCGRPSHNWIWRPTRRWSTDGHFDDVLAAVVDEVNPDVGLHFAIDN